MLLLLQKITVFKTFYSILDI